MDIMYRIRFYLTQFFTNLRWGWKEMICPQSIDAFYQEMQAQCAHISPEDEAEIAASFQAWFDPANEPTLDPRRTILFHSEPEERRCNAITAPAYRKMILQVWGWAREHGITIFLTDYATPFGLLALETLLELREADKTFLVYALKSLPFNKRKTYRTIPETRIEIAILTANADYCYHTSPMETKVRILSGAAMHCTEAGIWISREDISGDLLEAWGLSEGDLRQFRPESCL